MLPTSSYITSKSYQKKTHDFHFLCLSCGKHPKCVHTWLLQNSPLTVQAMSAYA